MDPLSLSASLIAVLQITGSLISFCYDYRQGVKHASKEIVQISDELNSLRDILDSLLKIAERAESNGFSQLSTFELLLKDDGPLFVCKTELEKLRGKLEKGGVGGSEGWRAVRERLVWPLKEGEVRKTLVVLDRLKNQTTRDIYRWLAAPDPFPTHSATLKKHQPNTGTWFITSKQYVDWYLGNDAFLWLYGTLEHLMTQVQQHPKIALAYFYFDFNGDLNGALKSLISQLSAQSSNVPRPLKTLYEELSTKTSTSPTDDVLLECFRNILLSFHHIYIVFDALDEAARNTEVLSFISTIKAWKYQRLRLLVTSRRLAEIEDVLSPLVSGRMCLQDNLSARNDIRYFISEKIEHDKIMSKWPQDIRDQIESKLTQEGDGMFRWVVCQLDMFRKCMSVSAIRKAMKTLPKSLDETYERILQQIDVDHQSEVSKILQALTVAVKRLNVEELVEILAIDIDSDLPCFDEDSRLLNPEIILSICSSLVTKFEPRSGQDEELKTKWKRDLPSQESGSSSPAVKLAHASVADYLTQSTTSPFHFTQYTARQFMAQACLAYLLNPEFSQGHEQKLLKSRYRKYPFLRHLTLNWPRYVNREPGDPDDYLAPRTRKLLRAFLETHKLEHGGNFAFWLGMMMPSAIGKESFVLRTHPLYYAASFGLADIVRIILDTEPDIDINALGGRAHATALHVACYREHYKVAKLLLERGADPDIPNVLGESPLYWARPNNPDGNMVELLLEHGANSAGRKRWSSVNDMPVEVPTVLCLR
ncbi:similar to ankyrin repeat domain-containing protein 29 [Botrytis cinerea T4]|uniref:Similar to ankyrin repeat domain-containing protein 29 n=1 Tax=Botryotinia fuckeliana (strain T4) TaxID=999810 RepID=G2Y3U7_BOTF4|nr:similar to ankyrin repeat domain-containing protein 29 [Botrytis cinerea T4]